MLDELYYKSGVNFMTDAYKGTTKQVTFEDQ